MTDAELDAEIRTILTRYTVAKHMDACAANWPKCFYAVWAKGVDHIPGTAKLLTEPASHRDAQAARVGLITADLLELIREIVPA